MVEDAELRKIAELARAHHLAIISDEVYERIVFDGRAYRSIAQVTENCTDALIVNSFSKTYAMTGWRCGWLIPTASTPIDQLEVDQPHDAAAAGDLPDAGYPGPMSGESSWTWQRRKRARASGSGCTGKEVGDGRG